MNIFRSTHNPIPLSGGQKRLDTHTGIAVIVVAMAIITFIYVLAFIIADELFLDLANKYLPLIMAVFSFYVVYKRLQHNFLFIWSPETWFYIFSAIQFGIGAVIYFYGSEEVIFSLDDIYPVDALLLIKTNILNSFTILLISLVFLLFPRYYYINQLHELSISNKPRVIKICIYFTVISILILLPSVKVSNLPSSFTILLKGISESLLVIFFFLWSSGERKAAKWAIMLLIIMSFISLPSFGKTIFIEPFFCAMLGILMGKKKIFIKYIILAGVLVFGLLVWYVPIAEFGRKEKIYDLPFKDRLDFTTEYILRKSYSNWETETNIINSLWKRQNLTTVQGFLVQQYDQGKSGTSFKDIWILFIPRILWPNKPITTNIAKELNEMLLGYASSSLAPSFNADAYWNGGWILAGIVSLYVGALFSVMSRLSLKYIGRLDFRYMPIAIWSITLGRYTEGFFASAFIGGVVIMIAWWLILKKILPALGKVEISPPIPQKYYHRQFPKVIG